MTDIEKVLSGGRAVQIKPRGYSMYPMLVPGRDEAIIEPVNPQNIKRGDVILYRREGSILVLHRIFKVSKEGVYLVGDNQEEVEGPLPLSCVKGRLTDIIRNGKKISVKNPVYCSASWLWLLLRPVRKPIKKTLAYIKRKLRVKH